MIVIIGRVFVTLLFKIEGMDNDKIKELFVDAINGISKQEAEAVKYDMYSLPSFLKLKE
jgi:hypothetical protein